MPFILPCVVSASTNSSALTKDEKPYFGIAIAAVANDSCDKKFLLPIVFIVWDSELFKIELNECLLLVRVGGRQKRKEDFHCSEED